MKTLNFKKISSILLSLVMLNTLSAVAQTSNTETEMPLEGLKAIRLSGLTNITIEQGNTNTLFLSYAPQDSDKIIHSFEDGVLRLNVSGNSSTYNIKVLFANLEEIRADGVSRIKNQGPLTSSQLDIRAEGTSNINLSNLEVGELTTRVSGACAIRYAGNAGSHKIHISGASSINALELETTDTEVQMSGAGVANVYAKNSLNGSISGFGNIYYAEEPAQINVETTGLGSVRQVDARTGSRGDGDTTRLRFGQNEVIILSDRDNDREKARNRKPKFDGHWGGIGLGLNMLTDKNYSLDMPTGYDFLETKMSKSLAFSLNLFEQNINIIKNNFGFTTGLGLTFNNYHFSQNTTLLAGHNTVAAVQDTVNDFLKNRLRVVYATLPLIFEAQTSGSTKFHFGAGMIMGVKIGSHLKQEYKIDKSKYTDLAYDDFNLNPFKADATVQIGWGIINLYANYGLLPLFKSSKNPELYPLTVGLKLIGW